MDKSIINMQNWEFYTSGKELMLRGIAEEHPKLGKNVEVVYTSTILSVNIVDDIIHVETRNSLYVCPIKYMNLTNKEKINDIEDVILDSEACKFIEVINSIANNESYSNKEYAEHILKLVEEGKRELKQFETDNNNRIIEEAKKYKQSLYIELSSISQGSKGAYNIDGETGIVEPLVHSGMFTDSVLYTKNNILDFRYFPNWTNMRVYSWSDNLENVVIKNIKNYEISVNNQVIKPNETIVVDKSTYECGLVSPNCVD